MANKANKWKKYLTRRKLIVLGVLVLAVVAALVAYLIIGQANRQANQREIAEKLPIKLLASDEVSRNIDQEQDESQKAKLYLDMVLSKQVEGKPDEALDAALKSIEIKPTHQAYAAAGSVYASKGETEKAIEMYGKAMDLTEKTENPDQISFYNDYRREIMALRGEG